MVVHFPIALWTLGTCFDLAALAGWPEFWRPAGQLILIGVGIGVISATAGAIDYVAMGDDEPARKTADTHLMLMGSAWSIYLMAYILRLSQGALTAEPALAPALLSIVGFFVMAAGAYFGGKLVYAHGVGVSLKKRSAHRS